MLSFVLLLAMMGGCGDCPGDNCEIHPDGSIECVQVSPNHVGPQVDQVEAITDNVISIGDASMTSAITFDAGEGIYYEPSWEETFCDCEEAEYVLLYTTGRYHNDREYQCFKSIDAMNEWISMPERDFHSVYGIFVPTERDIVKREINTFKRVKETRTEWEVK